MKKLTSIAAFLWCFCMGAQNWVFHPGTTYFPVHRFWNDTINDRLLAVGAFDTIGGIYSPGFAQWNGTSWSAVGLPGFPTAPQFGCITQYDTNIILGGNNLVMSWDGSSLDTIGQINVFGASTMLQFNSDLIIANLHNDDYIDNVNFNTVARWDGTNWYDMGQGQLAGGTHSIILYRDTLYIGAFSSIDNYYYVFRYVNNTWEIVGQRFYGAVYNMCVYNDELYAGSYNSGSGPGRAISKYDATADQWIAPGGGIFSSWGFSEVESMTVMGGRLYVLGDFDIAGGVHADRVAAWDGVQWCGLGNDTTWGMRQLATFHNSVYLSTGLIFDDTASTAFVEWAGGNYSDSCGIFDGVDEWQASLLRVDVFPNPASDNVTFQIFGEPAARTIILIDNLGREIWRKESRDNEVRLSTDGFAAGLYYYRIEESGEVKSSGKVIVE